MCLGWGFCDGLWGFVCLDWGFYVLGLGFLCAWMGVFAWIGGFDGLGILCACIRFCVLGLGGFVCLGDGVLCDGLGSFVCLDCRVSVFELWVLCAQIRGVLCSWIGEFRVLGLGGFV